MWSPNNAHLTMYYPGLYTTLNNCNSRPFGKTDNVLSSPDQHAELCSLMDKKKMVSNLSTSSLATSPLSLANSFRTTHFPASHYRPQTGTASDCTIMPSPYVSSSATHLPGSDNLSSSLLHEQSFLDASSPYGLGPMPPFSHYPQYIGNSVINPALKPPNGGTYSTHNSFYPPSGSPYHSLYPESFISDYITRNHIDVNKATYNNSTSDNSSFMEHLKRLQESFQSKSPKTSDVNNSNNASQHQASSSSNQVASVNPCSYIYPSNQPVRPEPISMQMCPNGSKSPVISSSQHQSSIVHNSFPYPAVNGNTVFSASTTSANEPSNRTNSASKVQCVVSNLPALSHSKNSSKSVDHVHDATRQQQLSSGNQSLVQSTSSCVSVNNKVEPCDRKPDASTEKKTKSVSMKSSKSNKKSSALTKSNCDQSRASDSTGAGKVSD